MNRIKELIEKAKLDSKKEFIKFTTEIYKINECVFEHIWDMPVVGLHDDNREFLISLSRNNDELLNKIEEYIKVKIGNNNSCFIYLNEINNIFAQEKNKEWQKELFSGLNYDAFIVYNEPKLRKEYKALIQNNSKRDIPKSQEYLDKLFTDYVKGIITYEICFLNANYLIKNNQQLRDETDYIEESKILINILKQIVNIYENGFTIEECLYKVMISRKEKLKYNRVNNKEILLLYILFTEELTEWLLFGAYDFDRENILKKVIAKIVGIDEIVSNEKLNEKLCRYIATLDEKTLSKKQIEMIEILGFSINKDTNLEIFEKEIENKKSDTNCSLKVIEEKNSLIKKFFSKILSFFIKNKSNMKAEL